MGFSSSKSSVKPIYSGQIEGAANTLTGAYNTAAPRINDVTNQITGLVPSLLDRYREGDPALNASRDYITSTLSGDGSNPHLQGMIDQSGNDIARSINANIGTRGLTGGSVQQHILAQELGRNATDLRYRDYGNQQQLRAQAAGMGPGVSAAQSGLLNPAFDAAQMSTLPLQAAGNYAAGIGGLLGQYTRTRSTTPWGPAILNAAATAAGSAAMASDVRLKEDIRRVGQTDGGLPVYTYRYKGSLKIHMGTMAHDVEKLQPHALGPVIEGYATVNYGEVR